MSYLQAVLLAEARKQGHGVRSALMRHRYLAPQAMAMMGWQLGAEPFTVGALAWGFAANDQNLVAPGEPRDRELAFRALSQVAKTFNPWFESEPPQLVLPNSAMLGLLRRLARRLAYLPNTGTKAADPQLIRFGKHLRFLTERARFPGQQVVIVLTELLGSHWVCELSAAEQHQLAALDAAIEPPTGCSVARAVEAAETLPIGPIPGENEDGPLDTLVTAFNQLRVQSTDPSVVEPLRTAIEAHYRALVFEHAWPLLWRCLERERPYPEAPGVAVRWKRDQEAWSKHQEWMAQADGRQRLRDSSDKAARTLRSWEEAERLLTASEAIDDRLRMLPYLMSNDAVFGRIVSADLTHREKPNKQWVLRPRFVLRVEHSCHLHLGKELFWTRHPHDYDYSIVAIEAAGQATLLTLQHCGGRDLVLPQVGEEAVFSIHHLNPDPPLWLLSKPPWTHIRASGDDSSLESHTQAWE